MSTMTIRAEFPLGTFLGHRDVGKRAEFPDSARLFSALVHAASKGSTALEVAGDLHMSDVSGHCLTWLEEHPPAAICQADVIPVSSRPAQAWRPDGVFEKRHGSIQARRVLKQQSAAVAVKGPFCWTWENVPDWVSSWCADIVSDISCLGEADSPVLLTVSPDAEEATHFLDPHQTGFPSPGGLPVRTPIRGRLDELNKDYAQAWGKKPPSPAQDKHAITQMPTGSETSADHVRYLTYRSVEPRVDAPWTHAIVLSLKHQDQRDPFADQSTSVSWAVALHRSIAAGLGDNAPPVITGSYPQGSERPANRIALHCLPTQAPTGFGLSGPAFVLLVPQQISQAEFTALHRVLRSLKEIRRSVVRARRKGRSSTSHMVLLDSVDVVSADAFWQPSPASTHRLWAPRVPLIPEVRAHRRRGWDLEQVAKISVGNVWREKLGRRRAHAELVEDVNRHGVRVYNAHLTLDSSVSDFVHRAPKDVVVQPYTCLLDLGDLAMPRTVAALGQSRHLGGGLLFPVDVAVRSSNDRQALR